MTIHVMRFCSGWLLAATLSFGPNVHAQIRSAASLRAPNLTMEFVWTGELEPLPDLYAILKDPSRAGDHGIAIRQIAAHGRFDRSTKVLLEFVEREVPKGLDRISTWQCCLAKMDVFMFLSLTGGKRAFKAMRDVFADENDHLVKGWMPALERIDGPDKIYTWKNSLRQRAAIGLAVSKNDTDERLVRQFFQDLHDLGLKRNVVEQDLYGKLAEGLVLADEANSPNSRGILYVGGGICLPDISEAVDAYTATGHRPEPLNFQFLNNLAFRM